MRPARPVVPSGRRAAAAATGAGDHRLGRPRGRPGRGRRVPARRLRGRGPECRGPQRAAAWPPPHRRGGPAGVRQPRRRRRPGDRRARAAGLVGRLVRDARGPGPGQGPRRRGRAGGNRLRAVPRVGHGRRPEDPGAGAGRRRRGQRPQRLARLADGVPLPGAGAGRNAVRPGGARRAPTGVRPRRPAFAVPGGRRDRRIPLPGRAGRHLHPSTRRARGQHRRADVLCATR